MALVFTWALGCAAPARRTETDLIADANRDFEQESYTLAIDEYGELLEQYPFSDYAEAARLKVAHAHYLAHQYDKAIAAFNDFERLHPTSPRMAFVEYTIGMCYLDQATVRDRDKTASENAMRQFERVAQRYPDSLYGYLATYRLEQSRENLAAHELAVADFYDRTGKRGAARARYEYLIETYPTTESASEAKRRLSVKR